MKILRRVIAVIAGVVLLVVAGTGLWLWRSVPPLSGRETVPGLSAEVTITFDSLAIPHIDAGSDSDAFAALGYLHARERLWSLEVLRRAAEGRLSEVLGSATVATDRYLKSVDIAYAADTSLGLVPPATRALLRSYVRGINAWIDGHTRPLPVEFDILRFKPEQWTERNVFEIARLMAWDLRNASAELELAGARVRLGDRVRDLFPAIPDTGVVILPRGSATWSGGVARPRGGGRSSERTEAPGHGGTGARGLPSVALAAGEIPQIPELAAALLDAASISRASNSWVIGSARTKSGKPILANDPHLTLRAPSLWYLAAINSPGFSVAGGTIAGLPVFVLGHNRRIAWGLTTMEADNFDYFIERLSADSTRVQTPDGWASVIATPDSIRVRGGQVVRFTRRRTPNGPLVDALPGPSADSGGTVRALAMRWVGHEPGDDLTPVLDVNRASDWTSFLNGVRHFKTNEQNWIYADVDGNIGYTSSGNVPLRHSGQGLLPTPGWTGEGRWERYLEFDELPHAFNPPEGFIVTANNRIVGPEYPFFITPSPAMPYRAERIREMVKGAAQATADDVRHMQMDSLDLFARWAKAIAARAAAAAGRPGMADSLNRWDGTMGGDRVEPAVFYVWYRNLQRMTYEDESPDYMPNSPLQHWMHEGASAWFDDVRTAGREDLAAVSLRAMRDALASTAGKRWGDLHQTVARHALGGVGPLDALLRLNLGPAPRSGSLYTVDVADFGQITPPFTNSHGPSFRQVIDMADVDGGTLIITGGQSGNPLSRHYRDQMKSWRRGVSARVALRSVRGAGATVLVLAPAH